MFNQAATPSVMYGSSARRSPEAVPKLRQKQFSQSAEPWIADRLDRAQYLSIITLLPLPQFIRPFK
jgi:hypothetical protein